MKRNYLAKRTLFAQQKVFIFFKQNILSQCSGGPEDQRLKLDKNQCPRDSQLGGLFSHETKGGDWRN